jgi:hypothetical protein
MVGPETTQKGEGVVAELRPWQPLKPLAGTVTGEATKVHGDDLVGGFRLPVRLGVKCGGEIQLHTRQREQFTLEVACEHRVPIANNRSRDPVEANDVVEEASGDGGCCVRVSQR